jgi:K+-sensing histidine kinase KdpD
MKISEILGERNHVSRLQFAGESLMGCWVVALLTFAGYELHFNPAPVGFLFLLVVVCEAILCGHAPAWTTSFIRRFCNSP